ncbi:MAG: twin-arginine translocase subunit TatC [Thermoplasmata archaeon]|nr:twin-arginine translocase subunit TatC [Candidatus Sysuiplasma jiujiangense]
MGEGMLDELQPHISELFQRLKHIGIAFVIVLLTVFMFNPLKLTFGLTGSFTVYVFRLISENIGGVKIITISPFESLFTDLFLGVVISVMILLPYILYNVFAFIIPGMSKREKRLLKLSLIPGTIMFIVGMSFAWYLLIPLMFHFTAILDPAMGVEPTVSAQKLIGLLLTIIFSLGLVFEMPLIISALVYLGIVDVQFLKAKWRYAVAGSFIAAWIISPGATGGLIETAMGLIFSGLYFSGIYLGKFMEVRKRSYVYVEA